MKLRLRSHLLLVFVGLLIAWPAAEGSAQVSDENDLATSTAAPLAALATLPTVYTWSTTTAGFAWLNASHWTGNAGHYPGVDANSNSIADGASNDVAAFSSMAFAASIVGINFSGSSSTGVSTNTGAGGSLTLGAIDYLSTTNKSISIGDNSGTAGTLTLTGVTLNNVANTVLANEGSNSLTLPSDWRGYSGHDLSSRQSNQQRHPGQSDWQYYDYYCN